MFNKKENVVFEDAGFLVSSSQRRITDTISPESFLRCFGQVDDTTHCDSLEIIFDGRLNDDSEPNNVVNHGLMIENVISRNVQFIEHAKVT